MCYMNGDNNLAAEVLHAVDMMETVGSTEDVDIIALVDGMPGDNGGYGSEWEQTRLLHITKDDEIGVINSTVLENLGEKNLGDPRVLEEFVKKCLRYPSEKYVFIVFAHGRGIIDTNSLSAEKERGYKTLLLSPDETSNRGMSHQEFSQALRNGLSGNRFDLMLFFSCLTNMVEVGYGLRELTDYMIGSEDEIRIVNEPPGSYQIRGIEPEKLIGTLTANTDAKPLSLGKMTIDSFINQYLITDPAGNGGAEKVEAKYPASLAMVDCRKYQTLAGALHELAQYLIGKLSDEQTGKKALTSFHRALSVSQRYASFLNLEYSDLQDMLEKLLEYSSDPQLKKLCQNTMDILHRELIVYERHTADSRSNGVSIFMPSFLLPENIYTSHRSMYGETSFDRDTAWGDLADVYRAQMQKRYSDILIDEYEQAVLAANLHLADRLSSKLSWSLRKDLLAGRYDATTRYLAILGKMERGKRPTRFLLSLQNSLNTPEKNGRSERLRQAVEVLLVAAELDQKGA